MDNGASELSHRYARLPNDEIINRTAIALTANGFEVTICDKASEAKDQVINTIPKGSAVFTISSETVRLCGLAEAIDVKKDYISVRNLLSSESDKRKKRKYGSTPDYAVGSLHALTEDGHIWIVSATGSQLAACVYGSEHVYYLVGAHKIVKNDVEAMDRIYNYTLPLESVRTQAAYGHPSRVGKILKIIDDSPGRSHILLIKERIGF